MTPHLQSYTTPKCPCFAGLSILMKSVTTDTTDQVKNVPLLFFLFNQDPGTQHLRYDHVPCFLGLPAFQPSNFNTESSISSISFRYIVSQCTISFYMTFLKWWNHRDRKQSGGCQGLGMLGEGGSLDDKGTAQEIFVMMELFCVLMVVVVTWIHTCDEMTQNTTHALFQYQALGFVIIL